MSITLLSRPNEVVAVLMGDLTISTLDEVLQTFVDISEEPEQNVSLDLTAVPTMDAAAIGLIIALNQRLRASGLDLTVYCPPGQPRGLISVIGLDEEVTVIDCTSTAIVYH